MEFLETKNYKIIRGAVKKAFAENGWIIVSGGVGYGKTQIKNELMRQYQLAGYRIVEMTCLEVMTINTVMRKMVRVLSSERPCRDTDALVEQFTRVVGDASYSHRIMLIIDEAQAIPHSTMLCIKRIHEIQFGSHDRLFAIMLIGKPKLEEYLAIEEIGLRVKHIQMQELSDDEVTAFLSKYPFTPEAKQRFCEVVSKTPLAVSKNAENLHETMEAMGARSITIAMIERFLNKSLEELKERARVSTHGIAKGTGMSPATVSQTINGTYPGDIKEKSRTIRSFLLETIKEQEMSLGGNKSKAL